jgi:hypothetical protein
MQGDRQKQTETDREKQRETERDKERERERERTSDIPDSGQRNGSSVLGGVTPPPPPPPHPSSSSCKLLMSSSFAPTSGLTPSSVLSSSCTFVSRQLSSSLFSPSWRMRRRRRRKRRKMFIRHIKHTYTYVLCINIYMYIRDALTSEP